MEEFCSNGDGKAIGLLGFDGVASLDLTGPLEAFAAARRYHTILIGVTGKTFVSSSGATFKAQTSLDDAPALHTIIVPGGGRLPHSEISRTIAAWLVKRARETCRMGAVSAGIYPLASAGLLNGRNVTTHWRLTHEIARKFSRVKVNEAASFVKDEGFYTCGGGTAAIEMTLAMIEADFGAGVALGVARELVMNLRPAAGNERQIDLSHYQGATEERLAELPAWITSRLQQDLSVHVLAERTCLCPRHFSRLFKRAFAMTPANFVEQLRIGEAQRRLASQRLSIETVAAAVGFKSTDVFRRAFVRRLGTSPSGFQRRVQRTASS